MTPEKPVETESEPCDCDHEPDEEHKALCLFWRAPLKVCPYSADEIQDMLAGMVFL